MTKESDMGRPVLDSVCFVKPTDTKAKVALILKGVTVTEDIKYLPNEGKKVVLTKYWLKREREGSVTVSTVPVAKSTVKPGDK